MSEGRDFDTWSVKNAFTREYFPQKVSCNYCLIPRCDAHMCVFNSGEIVKMQPCPQEAKDILYAIKYKNWVCSSCFIKSTPDITFSKKVSECIKLVVDKMSHFDCDFVKMFSYNLKDFLIKDTTLTCVTCSLSIQDYKWRTYRKLTSSYRKRRLESTIVI